MNTCHTCPITRSLPFVLAALALACSANNDPAVSEPARNGSAVPEGATGSTPPVSASPVENALPDEASSGDDEVGNGAASASDDRDGDGLSDSVETNTHVFLGPTNTGTDPGNPDSDGDGIADGDEVLGTAAGLDLPKMGASPLRKNILLEYDWFDDDNDGAECAGHSHRPTPGALKLVTDTFAASPVSNPDGSTGITIIHDYGQGGVFGGGNRIADSDGVIAGGVNDADFTNYRAKNFAANRQGYFHYVLLPHRYNTNDGSSGQAQKPGGDLIVSLYCYGTDHNVAATVVHELGHNLGLGHGGDSDLNYKPNYNSVMNYAYQFDGVDSNCAPPGDGVIDYSRNEHISLNETALDERRGTCGASAIDWNMNGAIESGISKDLNRDSSLGVLTDHDDWGRLTYDWHSRLRTRSLSEVVTCDSHPPGS